MATIFRPFKWLLQTGWRWLNFTRQLIINLVFLVLLILVIQGCIWINFSFPAITGKYLFYLSYLIVSSIQMGANIDYEVGAGDAEEEGAAHA